MPDIEARVECPTYGVTNSAYCCAVRHANAKYPASTFSLYASAYRPGSDDLACRDCEIGARMLAAGRDQKEKEMVMVEDIREGVVRCKSCREEFLQEDMGLHPRWKKPWTTCPACRALAIRAGIRKHGKTTQPRHRAGCPDISGKREIEDKKNCPATTKNTTLTLDFAGHEKLLGALDDSAREAFRTAPAQVLYFLSVMLPIGKKGCNTGLPVWEEAERG